ncbi:MAG: YdcF family protein [Gemmataceae bacterium]|nr:YdcF family protein [Gemmataceae bacterium]
MTEADIRELLFVRDAPERADLAIVFGHSDPARAGCRARHAARLYADGFVPQLLLSGGRLQGHGTEAAFMAGVVAGRGVPPGAVLLDHHARTTTQNVANARAILDADGRGAGLTAVLLVSCPWHMGRTRLLARRAFPASVRLLCCPHDDECTADRWIESVECCRLVAAEVALMTRLLGF